MRRAAARLAKRSRDAAGVTKLKATLQFVAAGLRCRTTAKVIADDRKDR